MLFFKPTLLNKSHGFTLIELIVVMALMSILLFFAVPRLNISLFTNDNRNLSSWILLTVRSLKETAQREKAEYILYVDMDNDQMWSARNVASASEEIPKENQYKLAEGFRLVDVEFPEMEAKSSGIAEIRFYPQGYSDKAIVHTEDNDNRRSSYLIEPFLPQVKLYDKFIEF